jgi:hypothetical protein
VSIDGVLDQTGYPFVERQQYASFSKRGVHDNRISRSREVLVEDSIGVASGKQARDSLTVIGSP